MPDWRDFKDTPMAIGAAEIYYWSMDAADLDRVPPDVSHAGTGNTGRDGWIGYIAGAYCSAFRREMAAASADLLTSRVVVSAGELGEDWVVSELEKTLEALADRVAEMRADPTNDNSRLSDDMSEPLCRSSLELPFSVELSISWTLCTDAQCPLT